ncbi:MAG: hypothetical protein AUK63_516 [bacterium P3]|nr:MAG: hypothetical protein AUK63_516 [bacterium P3]KWW41972.1 MAG: hypothetical protein F083_623 [bacterium F083]
MFLLALLSSFQFSFINTASAQVAGLSTLAVLDMPSDARSAAFSMDYLPVLDAGAMQRLDNPSLLFRPQRQVSLNVVTLFASSASGAVAYAFEAPHVGQVTLGLRFCSYGSFEGYDVNDQPTGEFRAGDYMLVLGWGLVVDSNFSIGANLKPVFSQYESYKAWAVAVDVAGSYVSDSRRLVASLAARNIGAQVATFDDEVERLPFELSAACSYKLLRAPFRLFAALTELQRWNLRYEDALNPSSSTDPFTGVTTRDSDGKVFFDRLARHVVVGLELDFNSRFFARVGYNYRQTKETQYAGNTNGSGFSFGLGLKGKRFDFSYARNNYHLSQAVNYFTLEFSL